MDIQKLRFDLVRYRIKEFTLIIEGLKDPIKVMNETINSLNMDFAFDNQYFPFFTMSITIPQETFRTIKKHNQNVRAFIDIQKAFFNDTLNLDTANDALWISWVKGNFFVFVNDMTPEIDEYRKKEMEEEEGVANRNISYGPLENLYILLYREEYLKASKKIINAVLTNTTLPDALTYVINKAEIKDVLLSPPSTYVPHKEFVITPITVGEQLDRICNDYGLHASGTLIFFDFNRLYILEQKPRPGAFIKNEFITTQLVSLAKTSEVTAIASGCFVDKTAKANVINMNEVYVSSNSVVNDQVYGNKFTVVDTKTGNVNVVDSGASKSGVSVSDATNVVMINQGANTAEAIKRTLFEASRTVRVNLSYVDIEMLAPNKEFVLSFDDASHQAYNGKYRISSLAVLFERDGGYWSPRITALLKG
jgi:hypothetical protein